MSNYSFIKGMTNEFLESKCVCNLNLAKLIHIFNAVYATKNFTLAAKMCNITKSSISRNISKLEFILKKQLFIRCGCNGVIPNQDADRFFFYADKLNELNKIIGLQYNLLPQISQLKICCHSLGSGYLMKALKKCNNLHICFFSEPRKDAYKKLLAGEYDIIFYPLQINDIAKAHKDNMEVKIFRDYEMCLFLNKDNIFAKMDANDITWEIIGKLNIVPINKYITFDPYLTFCNPHIQENLTESYDILLLLQGLLHNEWATICGYEFKQFCNSKNITIKKLTNNKFLSIKTYWCACYNDCNKKRKTIRNLLNKVY